MRIYTQDLEVEGFELVILTQHSFFIESQRYWNQQDRCLQWSFVLIIMPQTKISGQLCFPLTNFLMVFLVKIFVYVFNNNGFPIFIAGQTVFPHSFIYWFLTTCRIVKWYLDDTLVYLLITSVISSRDILHNLRSCLYLTSPENLSNHIVSYPANIRNMLVGII